MCIEDDNNIELSIYSPAGQDFHTSIETDNNPNTFIDNLYEAYNDFDVSYETYLWLDLDGHGKNGAPDDMRDVYNDMEAIEQSLLALHDELTKVYENMEA